MLAKKPFSITVATLALVSATQGTAQGDSNTNDPQILKNLTDCGAISSDKKRLACFDENIKTFQSAQEKGDIIVADKKVVEQAREDIFGYQTPDNPLFNGDNDSNLTQIESTIKSARKTRSGKYLFSIENGSVWQQTGTRNLRYKPEKGHSVIIEKASFGGFNAKIKDQRFIKVKRIK